MQYVVKVNIEGHIYLTLIRRHHLKKKVVMLHPDPVAASFKPYSIELVTTDAVLV